MRDPSAKPIWCSVTLQIEVRLARYPRELADGKRQRVVIERSVIFASVSAPAGGDAGDGADSATRLQKHDITASIYG